MKFLTKSRLIFVSIALVFMIFILSLYLIFGYTTVNLPNVTPSGLFVNGKFAGDNPKTVKLRNGKYKLTFTTPNTADSTLAISVGPFPRTINMPAGKSSTDMYQNARNATGFITGQFTYNNNKIFNTVWAAGVVDIPDQTSYLVMKFQQGRWDKVYLGDGTDSDFVVLIPQAIRDYLVELPAPGLGSFNGN